MLDAVAASGLPAKGDMNAMLELMGRQLTEKLGGTIDLREAAVLVERSRDAEAIERELDARQQQLLKVLLQQIETSPDADVTIRRLRAFETALLESDRRPRRGVPAVLRGCGGGGRGGSLDRGPARVNA